MESMETANLVDAHKLYMERVILTQGEYSPKPGWYQDNDGDLYHYAENHWDVLPQKVVDRLEFLG